MLWHVGDHGFDMRVTGDVAESIESSLREHGNMSSQTVLFVLDGMRKFGTPGPIVALAFGPGLIAEAAFLTPADGSPSDQIRQ